MSDTDPRCPSAQPSWPSAEIIGVVNGSVAEPRVRYLSERIGVTEELLAATAPAEPTEVLRIAAPCAKTACRHFAEERCRLVENVVKLLPVVTAELPPCRLRVHCRWWQQEGRAACLRCPQVVTQVPDPSSIQLKIVDTTKQCATTGESPAEATNEAS
jgi:hypothetical protein